MHRIFQYFLKQPLLPIRLTCFVQIVGYKGRAIIVVSCVTKDQPYRPHPHNLVGKESCNRGVCTMEIASENMTATFTHLGIQCVKKKDIEEALTVRQEIRVDPFDSTISLWYKNFANLST